MDDMMMDDYDDVIIIDAAYMLCYAKEEGIRGAMSMLIISHATITFI